MMRLILIRHGRTRANDEHLYCGSTDLSLSESGRDDLMKLLDRGGYPPLDGCRVYTSGMRRTEETLAALYGAVEHSSLPDLREMDFGSFEMHSYEQLKDDPVYREWCSGDNEANVAPGGESGRQMQRRVLAAVDELISKGEDAAVVLHGGPIAAIMAYLFPKEEKNRFDWQPQNGKGYLVTLDAADRAWTLFPQEDGKMDEKPKWEGKGYSFFQNEKCEYFPCHKTLHPENFNCLFCYCPLYALGDQCGGNFYYSEKGTKVCTKCLFPHIRSNYGKVLERYPEIQKLAAENRIHKKMDIE